MSLIIATYVPEGIVMASDSRRSITIEQKLPNGEIIKVETVNSDAVTKTFLLAKQRVGISNYGADLLKGIPISSHIQSFIQEELVEADDVTTIATKLIAYFNKSFPNTDVGFHVAGYMKEDKIGVPYVYNCHVGRNEVKRTNVAKNGSIIHGATWSGQIDIINSIVNPVIIPNSTGKGKVVRTTAPIIWDAMALKDAIDFTVYAIRTTIDTMRFQARPKSVGGKIDVLLLTPNQEPRWVE